MDNTTNITYLEAGRDPCPGMYIIPIIIRNDELDCRGFYVGESANIYSRIGTHLQGGWKKSGSQEWDVAADAKILMLHIPNSDNRKRTRLWIEMLVTQRINIVFGRDGVAINNASVDCAATKHKAKVAARAALFANINTIDEYLLEQAFKMNPPLEVAKSINKTMLQKHGGLSEVFETPPFNQFVDDRKIKLGSGRSKTGSGKRKKKPFAFKGYTTAPYISRGYTKI